MAFAGCGGGKKPSTKSASKTTTKQQPPPAETEADREKKRLAAAIAIVPSGSTCLPASLKDATAPRLELTAVAGDAMVCAVDHDRARLLGPVACWKVALQTGGLEYQEATPQRGRGFPIKLHDRCARGFCLPKDAKLPDGNVAHIVWSPSKEKPKAGDPPAPAKVAILAGDDLHLFDADSKAHETSFSIRGDKGVAGDPIGITWVGGAIFVEGSDGKTDSAVWGFKTEGGVATGPLEAIGAKNAKPLSTHGGSFVVLDKNRVAVVEQGFSTVTTYEVDSGKRAKLVRKLAKPPCKPEELSSFWGDGGDGVTPKCKDHLTKNFSHLIGADAVAGKTSLLVLLRGPRLGELAVLDAKTLAEKKSIQLPWCEDGADDAGAADKPGKADKAAPTKRGPVPKGASKDEDPDAGGE